MGERHAVSVNRQEFSEMKRHSETIGRRESLPRKVKKLATFTKKSERKKSKLRSFSLWNRLPNEIKALIVKKLDFETSVLFKECGWNELELVRNHTRNFVKISLNFSDWFTNTRPGIVIIPPIMRIEVKHTKSRGFQLEWSVCRSPCGGTWIEYSIENTRFEPRRIILPSKTVAAATSMILRRLLTEPMFVVNELELQLMKFDQEIDLDSISTDVGLLTVFNCHDKTPIFSILRNKNLNFKEIVGFTDCDRRMLYEFDSLTYGRPRTFHASCTYPYNRVGNHCSFSLQLQFYYDGNVYEQLKKFWNRTLGLYSFENESAVERTLELQKTVDDIMLLRAAYYYDDNCVPYIQNDTKYSDRIAFLEDGIDEHLSDYQLTILSIAYLVRLFRNEPEMEKIYDLAFEDLRHVLKKYENVNLYEKLVAKLEALVP